MSATGSIMNMDIREKCGSTRNLMWQVDQSTLKRFANKEKVDDGRFTGGWGRGKDKAKMRWNEGDGEFVGKRGFELSG